jgi:DNA-binding MarR family transcriptional regulator
MDTPRACPIREPPVPHLDGLLLHPTRFTVVAVLAAALDVELGFLREAAELDDAALSEQLRILGDGGLVARRRRWRGARRRTWVALTDQGRELMSAHTEALRSIASAATP